MAYANNMFNFDFKTASLKYDIFLWQGCISGYLFFKTFNAIMFNIYECTKITKLNYLDKSLIFN